jgi:AsmA protein
MKRIFYTIAAVLALTVTAFGALPLLVSSEAVRIRILEQARLLTGREMSFRDEPKVLFSPFLGIEVNSVIFEDPAARDDVPPLLQMEKLRGKLDLLPALLGRVSVGSYQLVRPRFHFRRANGVGNWNFPGGRIHEAVAALVRSRSTGTGPGGAQTADGERFSLGEFEIVDGTVEYIGGGEEGRETLTNINTRLVWTNSAAPLFATGRSIWRNEAFSFSARIDNPLMLMAGGSAQSEFELKSGAFNTRFSGLANTIADLHLSGSVAFDSPSIRRLAKFFGHDMQPGSMLSGFIAQGMLNGTLRQLQLSEATFALDGNRGRGVLQLARPRGRKTTINGTLAADTLDFSPYLAAYRQDIAIGKKSLPALELLNLLDMDLRISAGAANLDGVTLSDFAASISISSAAAVLNVGNAGLFGGVLVGKLELARGKTAPEMKLEGSLANFDARALTERLPGRRFGLSGTGNGEVTLHSHGTSGRELIENLTGTSRFSVANGALSGADLALLWKAAAAGESGSREFELAGLTPFVSLGGKVGFDRRHAWIKEATLEGPTVSAQAAGRTGIGLAAVALRLHLDRPGAGGDEVAGMHLSGDGEQLFVGGTIGAPLVTRMPNYPP